MSSVKMWGSGRIMAIWTGQMHLSSFEMFSEGALEDVGNNMCHGCGSVGRHPWGAGGDAGRWVVGGGEVRKGGGREVGKGRDAHPTGSGGSPRLR